MPTTQFPARILDAAVTRIESDPLGEVEVPAQRLYGPQTQRGHQLSAQRLLSAPPLAQRRLRHGGWYRSSDTGAPGRDRALRVGQGCSLREAVAALAPELLGRFDTLTSCASR